jgi:hypothetical protein
MKNSKDIFELTTFRLVVQCLNQLHYGVPPCSTNLDGKSERNDHFKGTLVSMSWRMILKHILTEWSFKIVG